ncbi:MAG: hypothetical protein PHN54_03355 [Bacilli bacterium]|nr:hypothetical protein [Bacilli bacterium]
MDIEKRVKDIIKIDIEKTGIILHDVKYIKEDNINYLRIIVDKDGYINLDDCIEVNKIIDPLLDKIDFIEESYILDVCSKVKEED